MVVVRMDVELALHFFNPENVKCHSTVKEKRGDQEDSEFGDVGCQRKNGS